jgi:MFS family permease
VDNVVARAVHFISRQPRNWKVTACRASIDKCSYQMVFPYLSVYISLLGATGTQLGVINSAGMVASAVLGLLAGGAVSRVGTKKVYSAGVALVALSYLVTGLARSWIIALVGTMLWWCGSTASGHSCAVVCGNSLANSDRATAMGCCESLAQGVMGFLGPVAGAMLVAGFGGVTPDGIRPVFFIASAMSLGSWFLIYTQLSEPGGLASAGEVSKQSSRRLPNPFLLLRQRPDLWRFVAVTCLTSLPTGMVLPFTQVFASQMKTADQYVLGAMVTGAAVIGLLLGVPLGRLADRVGRKKVLFALAPVYWAGNLLLVWSWHAGFLILSGVCQGAFYMTLMLTQAMAFELVPSEKTSDWLAVTKFFKMIAIAAMASVSGLIWDYAGPRYVFLLAVGIDAAIRIPLLASVPETLQLPGRSGEAGVGG